MWECGVWLSSVVLSWGLDIVLRAELLWLGIFLIVGLIVVWFLVIRLSWLVVSIVALLVKVSLSQVSIVWRIS